jgi:glycosyltransferase involved in cell wall biosynthesis
VRILHIIPSIAASRGGPTAVLFGLARAQCALGAEVRVVATRAGLSNSEEAAAHRKLDNVKITFVDTLGPAQLELAPRLLDTIAREARGCDVAHLHTVFTYPVAAPPLLLRILRVPYVVRPAGTLDAACIAMRSAKRKRLAIATYVKPNLIAAARVHVTSALEEREIRALVPGARTALVELAVETVSRVLPPPSGPPVIGSLGRLHPIKRLEVIINALTALPNVSLELAGDGAPSYVASLRDLAARRGVAERVRFLGHLDDEGKQAFFARCHVLAFPSLHESFGVAIAEGLAAGRPVVVSPQVGIADAIGAASAGRVADPSRFSEALAEVLARADHFSSAAAALARDRWGWRDAARRTLALYESANRARAT